MPSPSLPTADLLQAQAEWLAPARARLLRQAGIAHRRSILDLGAGYGAVTPELVRRSSGRVIACDLAAAPLSQISSGSAVAGDGRCLPFASGTFDLIFCQCVLLWIRGVETAVAEIARVLALGGIFVCLEPDYGGMMEYPPALQTKDIWHNALIRAGANPEIGRELPRLFSQHHFQVRVRLLDEIRPPQADRFSFLQDLPLLASERERLEQIMAKSGQLDEPWAQLAHLPFFQITAVKDA